MPCSRQGELCFGSGASYNKSVWKDQVWRASKRGYFMIDCGIRIASLCTAAVPLSMAPLQLSCGARSPRTMHAVHWLPSRSKRQCLLDCQLVWESPSCNAILEDRCISHFPDVESSRPTVQAPDTASIGMSRKVLKRITNKTSRISQGAFIERH